MEMPVWERRHKWTQGHVAGGPLGQTLTGTATAGNAERPWFHCVRLPRKVPEARPGGWCKVSSGETPYGH